MPKGKKTSSEKKVKVIVSKLNNPDNSLRDIEKETGVNHETVNDIIKKDMPEVLTSSDKTKSLYDMNLEIINNATSKVAKAMVDLSPEKIEEAKSMQDIVDKAFKQNRLIDEKATDIIEVNTSDILKGIQNGTIKKEDAYGLINKLNG